jgi:hypothetical protein
MGARIRAKHKKRARDIATAYHKEGKLNRPHKVADARSKRALKRKAYPQT